MKTLLDKLNEIIYGKKLTYTLEEFTNIFEEDIIILLIFLVTFPTSIPAPPYAGGFGTVPSGFITFLLAINLLINKKHLYLPDFIKRKKINTYFLKKNKWVVDKMHAISKYIKKRYTFVFQEIGTKFIAILFLANAILMMIPVFFTNLFPSLSCTVLSFLYLFKDGLLFLIAYILSVIMLVFYKFIYNILKTYFTRFLPTQR